MAESSSRQALHAVQNEEVMMIECRVGCTCTRRLQSGRQVLPGKAPPLCNNDIDSISNARATAFCTILNNSDAWNLKVRVVALDAEMHVAPY